jgi:hypothetical protein
MKTIKKRKVELTPRSWATKIQLLGDFSMTKYSIDFKMKVISEYLKGMRSTSLFQMYHIPSGHTLLNWVHRYQTSSIAGIKNHDKRPEYNTCSFKLNVLKWGRRIIYHSTIQLFTLISLHRLRSISGIGGLKQ